jgi:hypothetical protein
MSIELKVPPVGESINEVEIGEWLKKEGAAVGKDEPVAMLESEKASIELLAPEDGVLGKVLKATGEIAAVGDARPGPGNRRRPLQLQLGLRRQPNPAMGRLSSCRRRSGHWPTQD